MAEQLFVFIQLEFPWELGPPDGRYLVRESPEAEPERVLVIGTLAPGASRPVIAAAPAGRGLRGRRRRRGATRSTTAEPARANSARVTVIDPVPLSAEAQARAWLAELDIEREVTAAAAVVNRALHMHRVSSADPYAREVSPGQALVVRAGWGRGEEVADGVWAHARELLLPAPARRGRRRDRTASLRPQERFAALLGGRTDVLLCEDLALRARLDADHGRWEQAALQLQAALGAALPELGREGRQDLALRLAELEQLRPLVAAQARAAQGQAAEGAEGPGEGPGEGAGHPAQAAAVDPEVVEHALERLEAALRARSAAGFNVRR